MADGPDRERRAADLEGGVDLAVAVTGDRHAEVAGDRQVDDAVVARVGADEHDRVRVPVASARVGARVVAPEQQDVGRVREQEPVLRVERRLRPRAHPLVRVRDAASKREIAGDRPDDEQQDQGGDADADPPAPAPALSLAGGLRRAAVAVLAVLRLGMRGLGPQRNPPAHSPTAVDAVRLVGARHPAQYRSRGL